MWLFLGTEIMFFTAFIGTYIVLYFGSPGWPTDTHVTHINIAAGGINTFVLIFSSYMVVVAHEAMAQRKFDKDLNVAIMGCAVNGPGEAAGADLGVSLGRGRAHLFKRGQILRTVEEAEIVEAILKTIEDWE